jgi:hypothetical protein
VTTFVDRDRRQWTLSISLGWIDAVEARYGLDLHGPDWASQLAAYLRRAEPSAWCELIVSLVLRQADQRGIAAGDLLGILAEAGMPVVRAFLAEVHRVTGHPPNAVVVRLAGGHG